MATHLCQYRAALRPQKMNTEETVGYIKRALAISDYLGTSPYTWSGNKMEFSGRTSRRYLVYVAQLVLHLAYQSFVVGRWIQFSYFNPDATNQERSGLQYNTFSNCIPLFSHICTFFTAGQFHLFINRMKRYQQGSIRGKVQQARSKPHKLTD